MGITYVFKSMGGHDCLTDCYAIQQNGTTLFELDFRHLGQDSCGDGYEARKRAETLARDICAALNDKPDLY